MIMSNEAPKGPDMTLGVAADELAEGAMLLGHVGGEPVLLARTLGEIFAIGAVCTHYHGPLAEGLLHDATVRCPWHHACFDLRSGEALRAPALDPVSCWQVERRNGKIFIVEKKKPTPKRTASAKKSSGPIVIVGGGAAGFAAAEMLRRRNFTGKITILSSDSAPPVDRPNLSKDFLAGTAPEDWLPLRPGNFYNEADIELRLDTAVTKIDPRQKTVTSDKGEFTYDRMLLATGAEPVRLPIPGADLPHVSVLRTLADCRRIITLTKNAKQAVVIGASFIGLEIAASLRKRGIAVQVVAPEKLPMERTLGPDIGAFIKKLHQDNGVTFHLENTVVRIEAGRVELKSGPTLAADLVCVGVGVKPRTQLAEQAGLALDHGVLVNEYMETSVQDIFAAGDIARFPDRFGGKIRVEHWVAAERQGQTAALNMLGERQKHDAVPFFWSQHYDVPINYVGHAESWDRIEIDGRIEDSDCLVRYIKNGMVKAVASIFRDLDSLKCELAMETEPA
jgi:NADPH-dependent 2,4-dienoyl-CoA reductase/sulfur reductase-like enzyme/nitrite reductase/ring-hydroxylating ferredoxin subunit